MTDYLVVIPSRNRYELALRAVRSVLGQTVPPTEIVLVDDASTDKRYEWIGEIVGSPKLTIIREQVSSQDKTQQGFAVGTVRNVGLEYARRIGFDGWIAFIDDDDEWMPTKMATQFEAAGRYDEIHCFCSNALNRSLTGEICGYHHGPHGRRLGNGYRDVTACLAEFNPVINSTAIVATKVARKVGLQQAAGFGEDWDYWRRVAILSPVIRLDEPLALYTVNNNKEYRL